MNLELNIIFLFFFILSCVYVLNSIVKLVVSVLQTPPKQLNYTVVEKLCNYFFITYFITFIILKF